MFYFVKKANSAYILIGGGFIGTGAFGCVFYPDIKKKDPNIVSKLVMRAEGIKEVEILKIIKRIDPEGSFHSLLLEYFNFEMDEAEWRREVLNDCKPVGWNVPAKELTEKGWWDTHLVVLNISYVGSYKLNVYIRNILPKLNYDKLGLFFVRLSNILRGLFLLSTNKIIHSDIHTENIMLSGNIDRDIYDIKIIDFGISEQDMGGLYDTTTFFGQILEEFNTPFGKKPKSNGTSIFEDMKMLWTQCGEREVESQGVDKDFIYIIEKYLQFIDNSFGDILAKQAFREYFSYIIRPS